MKPLVAAILLVLASATARAHPGIGIVVDARGNVYYTDLTHVWRIAPDGKRTVAVRGVHTHELHLDAQGNLYGEHLWYNGEAANTWGHYVWRLRPSGVLDTIIAPKEGFLSGYSFVRDREGTMYWVDRERGQVRKRPANSATDAVHASHPFRDARWATMTPGGTMYLTDDGDLLRIDPNGTVTTIARKMRDKKFGQFTVPESQSLMGIWVDHAGAAYVAVWKGRMVKRVTPAGAVSIVARSAIGWGPSGGVVAPNGDMYVLETSLTNRVRVQLYGKDGTRRVWPE